MLRLPGAEGKWTRRYRHSRHIIYFAGDLSGLEVGKFYSDGEGSNAKALTIR